MIHLTRTGFAPRRLDRERRIVERLRVVDRAVAPHLGRAETHRRREDLLLELANADPVVVDRPALLAVQLAAARHRRRDHQRRRVLRDRRGIEHAGPERLRPRPAADESPLDQTGPGPGPGLHEPPPRDRRRDGRPVPALTTSLGHLKTSSSTAARPSAGLAQRSVAPSATPLCGPGAPPPPPVGVGGGHPTLSPPPMLVLAPFPPYPCVLRVPPAGARCWGGAGRGPRRARTPRRSSWRASEWR